MYSFIRHQLSGKAPGRVGFRLIATSILVSSLLALSITTYQFFQARDRELSRVNQNISLIKSVYHDSLAQVIWLLDENLIVTQLQSILSFPDIENVTLSNDVGSYWELGQVRSESTEKFLFKISVLDRGEPTAVGELVVTVGYDQIYRDLVAEIVILLLANLAKTITVALIMLILFKRLVTRHLLTMSAWLSSFDINKPLNPMTLSGRAFEEDIDFKGNEILTLYSGIRKMSSRAVEDVIARKESELQLDAILRTAPEAIISVNHGNTVIVFNSGAERTFGYESKDVIGHSIDMLLPERVRDTHHGFIDAFSRSGEQYRPMPEHGEISGVRKDGTEFPASASLSWVELKGEKVFTVILRDISDLKLAQAQLIQSSKLASLGEMATGIAHEISQPLNIIRMSTDTLTEILEEGEVPATDFLNTKLAQITSQITRASDIIDRMRIFGRRPLDQAMRVSLKDAVLGAVGFLGEQLRLSGIEMKSDIPETCRPVMGDLVQLEQVVLNLVSNARDAIESKARLTPGGDTPDCIGVSIEDDLTKGVIKLIVRDTGGGISQDILPKIFDPFFTSKEIGKGTGVGLSISYGIVTEMGGDIIASNTDGGAKFTVVLPVADKEHRPA